jgi:pyruvate formate lyase activating enzyme
MDIAGVQKLTLLDIPGKTAATVFTAGCNLRCPFCQNSELVLPEQLADVLLTSVDEVLSFLETRHGLLDGVCISGGEPLVQDGVEEFCARVHEAGFLVKLDTNGSYPDRLARLVENGLIDQVALDVKNEPDRYPETVGVPGFDVAPVRRSVEFLLEGEVPYEFRTTVVAEFHPDESLVATSEWIAGASAWYLQGFKDADTVLCGKGRLHARDPKELEALLPRLRESVSNTQLRGV